MNFVGTVGGSTDGTQELQGLQPDVIWAWGTIALSVLLTVGYCAIAVNWYCQSKLARHAEAKAALARLRNICITCGFSGYAIYVADAPWLVWRLYDAVLMALLLYTWSFVWRMRGLSLIHERLAHLSNLERTAAKYREIAELLPHMVWTATAEGRVDFSNQQWRSYATDGRSWLEAVHPTERLEASARWQDAVANCEPLTMEVSLGGCAGGTYRTFIVKATPIIKGNGVKWLGACADIEDQKLLASQKELQARQKSFFLNALSHDLRAPLHNVLLNAHVLKMSAHDQADTETLNTIIENAVSAGDLVTKLLEFAKAGAQDENRLESVSLTSMLQQIVRRFQPIAEKKHLSLRFAESPAADATILTDRQKLERIVSNLVDNAIKYTSKGGVSLAFVVNGHQTCVRVCDSGEGIPPESVPYLFDEFYQVNNYARDRSKGFGIGLAICRSLARHLRGEVRLASTGPEGSCFELALTDVGSDRRGRPGGQEGDLAHPEDVRLCRA
jgi:nitrogen-specific signal transduction histidine kinase